MMSTSKLHALLIDAKFWSATFKCLLQSTTVMPLTLLTHNRFSHPTTMLFTKSLISPVFLLSKTNCLFSEYGHHWVKPHKDHYRLRLSLMGPQWGPLLSVLWLLSLCCQKCKHWLVAIHTTPFSAKILWIRSVHSCLFNTRLSITFCSLNRMKRGKENLQNIACEVLHP